MVLDLSLILMVIVLIMVYLLQRYRVMLLLNNQLQKQQDKIRLIIDTVPSLIFLTDDRLNILLVNVSFAEMFNLSVEDMIGQSLTKFISDTKTLLKIQADTDSILQKNRTEHGGELSLINPRSGETHYYNMSRSVFRNGIVGVITIANDITTLKHTIDRLRVTQNHYSDLVESSSNLILQIAPDMSIIYTNATCRKHLGYEPQECLGMKWSDIIGIADRPFAIKQFSRWSYFATQKEERWECEVITRTGITKTFLWDITIIWRESEFIGLQLNGVDITIKSQQELELKQAKLLLAETNKKLLIEQGQYRDIVETYEVMVKTTLK